MKNKITLTQWMLPCVLLSLAACGKSADPAKAGAPAGGPPPAMVSVITIAPEQVSNINELAGRVEAVRTAEVRARVGGIVQKRLFNEGAEVRLGQPLYEIDPAPLQAALASADAVLAKAEANLGQANAKANRYKGLVDSNAISKQEYEDLVSNQKLAAADVAGARAAVDSAKLNLSYTTVNAPIAGRIGRSLITEGALVTANDARSLAMIQQLDPIFVTLTQSTAELSQLRALMAQAGKGGVKAKLTLITEDGQSYPHPGQLLFAEALVNPESSSMILRAQFSNPERALLPGMYVRVRIEQGVRPGTILVPQQAVMRTVDGAIVMTVDAEGKVVPRPVKTSGTYGNQWIVGSGLKFGDSVIVEGLQKAKPGAVVKALPWKPAEPVAPAAPAAGSATAAPQPKP